MKLASCLDRSITLQDLKVTAAPGRKARKVESAKRIDFGHLRRSLATDVPASRQLHEHLHLDCKLLSILDAQDTNPAFVKALQEPRFSGSIPATTVCNSRHSYPQLQTLIAFDATPYPKSTDQKRKRLCRRSSFHHQCCADQRSRPNVGAKIQIPQSILFVAFKFLLQIE